ncbi:MAG TPA: gamma subclass chorismate mutase AroQ, partial [Steroidobacteraceae bacterium]|nr:gamma subclass chorismate mutase AroQ [Steroidobacteraceae bacterium]
MARALFFLLALVAGAHADAHFSSARERVDQVFRLADERMALMPGVAAYKWQKKAPVTDPERERAVTAHAVEVARTMGLAPEGIQALFDLQVRAARESQIRLHEAWRRRGYDFPGPVPDLARDVRPTLDRFTVDFLRALYRAAPDLERTNFATVAGKSIDSLRAPGWTDDDKRELLADLSRVHRIPFGAGSPTRLERIKAAGVLRVGTTGDYAPFSVEQQGVLSGADIDLAESLAKRLGATPLFVRTTWKTMLDDLQADEFDLAVGGVS